MTLIKKMKPAISFGSCMAGSTIQAIREEFQPDIKFVSRVLHNRIDQFLDCFVKNTYRPLEWNDISHIIKSSVSNDALSDLRLFINNQSGSTIGRHAIDIDTSFFEAMANSKEPLVVIDNYMDIASKLLEQNESKRKGFLNWSALDTDRMTESLRVVDYITPADYIKCLTELLSYFRLLSPNASIALVLFPSEIALNNDRSSVEKSKKINEAIAHEASAISEHFNVVIHKSRTVTENDLVSPTDWSHYSKNYYHEIARQVIQGQELIKEKIQVILPSVGPRIEDEYADESDKSALYSQFTVSVVIQFFQDFDHIEDVINATTWADKIIINDGPFAFAQPVFEYILEEEKLYKKRSLDYFQELARRTGSNIIYTYNIFADEREKRVFGYSQAQSDIVLSIDADEILDIDKNSLRSFVASDALVGMFECVNLSFHNMCISKPMPLATGPYPGKPFAFKRNLVDGERHLDYLWLVGTKQAKTSTSEYYLQPICKGLHFTNVRSAKGAAVKFGFYTALSWKEDALKARQGPFADCSYYFSPSNGFSHELKHEILANALPASLGFPEGFSLALFSEKKSPYLASIANIKNTKFKPDITTNSTTKAVLPGIPTYFYAKEFKTLTIYCNHSMPAQIVLHYYTVGSPAEQTRVSGDPHSFSMTSNEPYVVDLEILERGISPQIIHTAKKATVFCLLQACCWSGDDVKARIKETGIPVLMSFHLAPQAFKLIDYQAA